MKGGEKHFDLREELKDIPPSDGKDVLLLATPPPQAKHLIVEATGYNGQADPSSNPDAKCTVQRFTQYAICEEMLGEWAPKVGGVPSPRNWTALSFGGNGYDDWSSFLSKRIDGLVPELFDCFDTTEVRGTILHPTCIGGVEQRSADNQMRDFQDIAIFLKEKPDRSVLAKLDIEGSEFAVLGEIESATLRKIASLTVEFHFHKGPYKQPCRKLPELRALFSKLADEFVVIDGAAMRWGPSLCGLGDDYTWPTALSVSYVAKDLLHQ